MSDVPYLTALGFCGADDSVHPHQLALISQAFPLTEFGVLFRPDREGTPRYASPAWVERLGATAASMRAAGHTMKLAGHLCGSRVNDLFENRGGDFLQYLIHAGFQRVQINATSVNGVDTTRLAEAVPVLWRTMQEFRQLEFILQKNLETQPLWKGVEEMMINESFSNVSMLLDESKGTGVLSSSWPAPSTSCSTGYAGGIGPINVVAVLEDITKAVQAGNSKSFWIDMESSLRSMKNGDDVFDLDKCFQVIDATCSLQLMERPNYLK